MGFFVGFFLKTRSNVYSVQEIRTLLPKDNPGSVTPISSGLSIEFEVIYLQHIHFNFLNDTKQLKSMYMYRLL